jgi:NAD(P)-dependent dehydrogenase (short-subunit alcohol dehydrogenase family)
VDAIGAVVTGGAGGLGREIARRLQSDGWQVALLDLPTSDVRTVADEMGVTALPADVTDETATEAALSAFAVPLGLMVNNAGVVRFGALLDQPASEFEAVLRINLLGTLIGAKAAARRMKPGSAIVNITSKNGIHPVPSTGAYGPSKAGVAMLTQIMALEWAHLGIRVNSVAPGALIDGMSAPLYADARVRAAREATIPAGRLGTAFDVANAVAFLASRDASYITGQNLVVDGGVTATILSGLPYAGQRQEGGAQ